MSLDDVQQDLAELLLSHGGLDDDDLLAPVAYSMQHSSAGVAELNAWGLLETEFDVRCRRRSHKYPPTHRFWL